jgi:hypothetical protein
MTDALTPEESSPEEMVLPSPPLIPLIAPDDLSSLSAMEIMEAMDVALYDAGLLAAQLRRFVLAPE